MKNTVFMYHAPNPLSYSPLTIWTPDGLKAIPLFNLLVALKVISIKNFT